MNPTLRTSISALTMALLLTIVTDVAVPRGLSAQMPDADIRNFRAVDVSDAELRVTVDYTYPEAMGGRVLLHAAPVQRGGAIDPRFGRPVPLSVRPGASTSTLTLRKGLSVENFTSVAVRVCLSTRTRALVCRTFPHVKRWTGAPQPPPPPADDEPTPDQRPPSEPEPEPEPDADTDAGTEVEDEPTSQPEPAQEPEPPPSRAPTSPPSPSQAGQTCTVTGYLTGRLTGVIRSGVPGAPTRVVRLRRMLAHGRDGTRVAVVADGRYTFSNLPVGVYRITPSAFRSTPALQGVVCTPNSTHRVNFHVLGPKPRPS